MAKKYINQGVALIKERGAPVTKKSNDYKEAERIFSNVETNYARDYIYGYNAYGKAYFEKKEFGSSLKKFNRAYQIDKTKIDTLNNLGFYYSKVPAYHYKKIRSQIPDFYKNDKMFQDKDFKQLDTAIAFYRKTLDIDPENITSLFGIGNAYLYQNQFQKAKNYYKNILKVDKDSIVGYSGLLNLFIERDNIFQVLSINSRLRINNTISDVPSALLGKLASYYLSKKRTDKRNIRIDYGIESPQVKDIQDNPYPAVENILKALKRRDNRYPPLYLHLARLNRETKNLRLMERNLKNAINEEPNYFGALHLLGEFQYMTNNPEVLLRVAMWGNLVGSGTIIMGAAGIAGVNSVTNAKDDLNALRYALAMGSSGGQQGVHLRMGNDLVHWGIEVNGQKIVGHLNLPMGVPGMMWSKGQANLTPALMAAWWQFRY